MTNTLYRRMASSILYVFAFIGLFSLLGLGYLWMNSGHHSQQSGVTSSQFHAALLGGKRLKKATNGQAVPEQYFHGPDGLIGIVGKDKKSGHRFIAWTSPHGKALISGPVVTGQGNLTHKYMKRLKNKGSIKQSVQSHSSTSSQSHSETNGKSGKAIASNGNNEGGNTKSYSTGSIHTGSHSSRHSRKSKSEPKAVSKISAKFYNRVKSSALPLKGKNKKAPVLYMFEDPSCVHCQRALSKLKPLVKSGKIQLGVVPVGILSTLGARAATALVAHPKHLSVFTNDKKLAKKSLTKKALHQVKHNRQLLKKVAGVLATPVFVYQTRSGQYKRHIGNPDHKMEKLIHSIKG